MRRGEQVSRIGRHTVADRRHSPRVEVLEEIQGHIPPHDVSVTLIDVSHGGFMMQSPVAYAVGDVHKFRITIIGEYPIVLRGRVAHQRQLPTNAATAYLIGVAFTDRQITACAEAIDVLVAAVSRRK